MNDIVNPIQNTSYTKKDFESIYVELLDIVKELTYKWDPTISNESDPGVILLKLNAIIADKCNYNIDKNVLEAFPLSVTQTPNARQLFEQLGYCMKWYRGATTDICLQFTGEYDAEYKYTIPAFTMVTDGDSNVVYTLVGPKDESGRYDTNIGDMLLPCDNSVLVANAIQGVAVDYSINGDKLITTSMLDSNNRLYFNYTNIAENGIFIRNSDTYNYNDWERKDNLLIEELGNTFYKFGVTQDGFNCYLEFPEDAETIFKDGIYITYVRTDGDYGNIALGVIEKFYNDISAVNSEGKSVILNGTNVLIKNNYKASNGKNPETINEGYHNYKKVVGTFDTLVTLRDYFNAIVNNQLGSNGFVCDRTNDIQVTYDIMSLINGLDQPSLEYEHLSEGDNDLIDSFELKFYITKYANGVEDLTDYLTTYQLMTKNELNTVEMYLEDTKSLQHEYSYILPTLGAGTPMFMKNRLYNVGDYVTYYDANDVPKIYRCLVKKAIGADFDYNNFEEVDSDSRFSHYCMFRNRYSISGQITPQYELTRTQKLELVANVYEALFRKLNAQEVDFGDEIPSDLIYEIISESDNRIKKFSYLSNIDYDTYAVYWNGFEFVETPINGDGYFPVEVKFVRNGKVQFESPVSRRYDINDKLYKWAFGKNLTVTVDYEKFFEYTSVHSSDPAEICRERVNCTNFIVSYSSGGAWNLHYVLYDDPSHARTVTLSDLGIVITGTYSEGDSFQIGYSDGYQFRNEIYTKSVLAGKTQLFVNGDEYDYRFDQQQVSQPEPPEERPTNIDNIEYVKPSVIMTVDSLTSPEENDMKYYRLKENETIQFFTPNLLEVTSYSEDVKYECYFHPENVTQVLLGTNYELKDGEFIIFYWKESAEDLLYHYYAYGKGNIINSTFTLSNTGLQKGEPSYYFSQFNWRNIGSASSEILVADTSKSGIIPKDLSDAILKLVVSTQILSGSKKITIKKRNSLYLDHNSYYCYWTLNNTVDDKYVLFEHDAFDDKYTLGSGEYFYYTDATMSQLAILGAGTTIERIGDNVEEWSVDAINSEEILTNGISAISAYWWQIPAGNYAKVTENQFVSIGSGGGIYFKENGWASSPDGWKITVTTDAIYATNLNWNVGDDPADYPIVDGDSGSVRTLKDFIIKYMIDNVLYTLEGAESDNYGWDARSILNMNISPNKQMHLLENQSITYKRIDNDVEEVITGEEFHDGGVEEQSYYPVCLVGSFPINNEGSDKFITYEESTDGTLNYLSLYLFKTVGDWDDVIYRVDGGVALYFRKGGSLDEERTKSFDFCVPEGKYIVTVKNIYPYLTGGSIKLDGQDVTLVNSTKNVDFTVPGTWTIELIVTSYTTHTLSVSITGHQEYQDTIIVLGDPYAYSVPENMSSDTFAVYNRLLKRFDPDGKYDYNYIVDEDLNISDPLKAETFFYTTHIYNKFTIGEIDLSRLNVILAGKK